MASPRPTPGTLYSFLRELRTTGAPVVRVQGGGELRECLGLIEDDSARDGRVLGLLREWHREAQLDLAGPSLAFDAAAAAWGAKLLFRAAWFYLDRESESDQVAAMLAEPMPGAATPAAVFSADLTLQWMPGVFRLARTLAPGDPLLIALRKLAVALPLSGVGVEPEMEAVLPVLTSLQAHAGLWQLFIDRVVQSNARWWLRVPSVRDALQQVAGAFPQELVPALDLSQFTTPALS